MKSLESKIKRVIVGKLEPDEDIIDSIIQMIKNHDIKSGLINCIGALKKYTIGYFDFDSKQYLQKTFDEYIELVSCMGNISFKDGDPVVHLHISIGKRDYKIIGGHLLQPSIVSITGEVYIFEIDKKLERTTDPQLNLSLLDIQ
ncbi:MAG: PPC domain-containing DNA-binding protein [Candidatus Thorarchaeota archaeon]